MHTRIIPLATLTVLLLAATTLGGCVTDSGAGPSAQASADAPAKPLTHQEAALQCWMSTEKDAAHMTLDHRADVVTKCISDKMKAAGEAADTSKPVPVRAGSSGLAPPKP